MDSVTSGLSHSQVTHEVTNRGGLS